MFTEFEPSLLDDPEFKEDSVREVIIAPMLTRLGYSPSGCNKIVRSKSLVHPYIYIGTRRHPVTIIPDYTLSNDQKSLLVLDAKNPQENLLSRENVQQAYSYAIHPEIRCEHFALCNGRLLVVFEVGKDKPVFSVEFSEFESRWAEIERYLGPRFLETPALRRFAPDFGAELVRLGFPIGGSITLVPAQLNLFARVRDNLITASSNCDFSNRPHCVSFDFHPKILPALLAGLPLALSKAFKKALTRAPFMAAAELAIEVDIVTKLGAKATGREEDFCPLIIKKVLASRFRPLPHPAGEAEDIPPEVYRLRRACKIQ